MYSDISAASPAPAAQRFAPKGLGGIFVVSFAVLFVTAVCARLLALGRRPWRAGGDSRRSIVASVRSSVYNLLSYIP